MTTTRDSQSPSPPAGSSRSWRSFAAIAALSLAVGAAGMFFALRGRIADQSAQAPHAAEHADALALQAMESGPPPTAPPSDQAVHISPARQQLIGVRTASVSSQSLETTIRTVGVLAYDETRVAEIHTKIAGWVESVSVDFVGKSVDRGQPLFQVYSPDLVATQKEYLLALKAQEQLGRSQIAETREGAGSLLAAARERLRLWDVTEAQIEALERTREPRKSLAVYSPVSGVVLERNAYPGQYVTPELSTFRIVDLSTIWVIGQIFEYELPLVKLGQSAEIQFPYGGSSQTLTGRITFIYPEVDAMTRRVKVRIELRNPGLEFKPESYVTVLIRTGGGRRLAVPKEAVIDTGRQRYVLLALADGYFEPRQIEVGEPVDDFYPVRSGLAEGDRVVTSAQFLIDSETNLQAAMQAMAGMPGMDGSGDGVSGIPAGDGASPKSAPAAGLDIVFRSQPDPPEAGDNTFEVTVTDAQGAPVIDAQVTVTFFMPAMPSMAMPAMQSSATLPHAGNGVYRGEGEVVMGGRWDVTVTVSRDGARLGSRRLAVVAQ